MLNAVRDFMGKITAAPDTSAQQLELDAVRLSIVSMFVEQITVR